MRPMLEARALTKYYEQGSVTVAAIENVSFSLSAGEVTLIIGPSGSGKSTLLSMLGCILRPTSGAIFLAGREVSALTDRDLPRIRRRCFGFVFQSFHLFPFLTARENVETALRLRNIPAVQRRRRSIDLLRDCGLEDRIEFYPASLSGGEKQRIAIARALAGDPFVLLADEPTGALDSANGEHILSMLRRFALEKKKAVVMASHDPTARRFADKIYSLVDGRIGLMPE